MCRRSRLSEIGEPLYILDVLGGSYSTTDSLVMFLRYVLKSRGEELLIEQHLTSLFYIVDLDSRKSKNVWSLRWSGMVMVPLVNFLT